MTLAGPGKGPSRMNNCWQEAPAEQLEEGSARGPAAAGMAKRLQTGCFPGGRDQFVSMGKQSTCHGAAVRSCPWAFI